LKKQLRKQNTMKELKGAFLKDIRDCLTKQEPLQLGITLPSTIVDGKWESCGDNKLDRMWLDIMDATQTASDKEGFSVEETDMPK